MGRGNGSDSGASKYIVDAMDNVEKGGAMVRRSDSSNQLAPLPGGVAGTGMDKDSIMKFYKKRTILPQEKLGAAADLKRNMKDVNFAADDFRLDPEEVAFLRTLKEEYAHRRRWRWWHYLLLVLINNFLWVAIGGSMVFSYLGIESGSDGHSFKAGPISVDGLTVSDVDNEQHVLVHSGSGAASMELRAAMAGESSELILSGDKWAHLKGRGPGGSKFRFKMSATDEGHFSLAQGNTSRMQISSLDNSQMSGDVDIKMDPGPGGELTVHDDLSIGSAHMRTRLADLTVQAADNATLGIVVGGNGTVAIDAVSTEASGGLQVAGVTNLLGNSFVRSGNLDARDASGYGVAVTGDTTRMDTTVYLRGSLLQETDDPVKITGRLDAYGETYLRGHTQALSMEVVDRLDISGETFIGTSLMDELYITSHISSRTMLFDEDHSSLLGSVGSLLVQFPDPDENEIISFPSESGTILTSASLFSSLTKVGTLTRGSIGEGFGGAYLAYANIQGVVSTQSNVDLGDDHYDLIAINGRLTNDLMTFDKNADGIALRIRFPDPTYYQGRDIEFPDEDGMVLTDSSLSSSLTKVGALTNGSIADGFGSANVESLISRGSSHLRGDMRLGTTASQALTISAHINSPSLLFDADSNGQGTRLQFVDHPNVIAFPNETGTVLSSVSDYSTLRHVSGLLSGSLEPGFGAATVASIHSTGDSAFDADMTIGLTLEESLTINAMIVTQELVFDANTDGVNRLTIFYPDPAGPERIEFPAETGQLLTTVSLTSSLTTVGTLGVGALGPTFGDASVAELTSRSDTSLCTRGAGSNPTCAMAFGTNVQDSLAINGHITTSQLIFNADSTAGRMTFSFPDPAVDRSIVVPDESGSMLTSSSFDSVLTSVGTLLTGAIAGSFGDIIVPSDIRSTNPMSVLAAAGDLHIGGGATLGDEQSDEISIRGTLTVKNQGIAVAVIDPERGDTTISGNMHVQGIISTESPFATSEFTVATINEFEADGGVTIEGVLMRDGGIIHTLIDRVDEMFAGEGVTIDGVVMKNGALITESATGTTAKGEVDLIRIINTGHDADMDNTITNIKFRQTYHDLSGNGEHEPSDMVKLSAVTQSDWNQRESSRDAYFKISVIEGGVMKERLRLTAEGHMLLNTDTIIVDGPTGNTLIHGNVTVGDMEDPRELLVKSTDSQAELIVTSVTSDAKLHVAGGDQGGGSVTISSGEDMESRLTFEDTSATTGIEYSIVLDGISNIMNFTASGSSASGRRMLTGASDTLMTMEGLETSINMYGVTHAYGEQVGSVGITGELTVVNCDVTGDLVANSHITMGDTQLGDHENDTLIIRGRYAANYILVDAENDGLNLLNLTFADASEPHEISFPSETGEVLTTASNYSTLQAVGNLSVGNIVEGFGSAHVASMVSTAGVELNGGTSIGNDAEDAIAVAGFITSGYLMFDTDYNDECTVLLFDDPKTDYTYYGLKTQVLITINVPSGDFPQDLSWTLTETVSGKMVRSEVGVPAGIDGAFLELLPDGTAYTFTIRDSNGDGIFSPGYVRVQVDQRNGTVEDASTNYLAGFASIWVNEFIAGSLDNDVLKAPERPTGAGNADAFFNSSHCKPEESNIVKFPTQDGTLIVKHNGNGTLGERWETLLDGDIYLGTELSDRIFFPGQIDKEIRFTNSSIILGDEPMFFGGDTYGTVMTNGGDFENETYTSDYRMTIGMPSLNTSSQKITFPDESGMVLTSTSDYSTLLELGNLTYLTVDGDTMLGQGGDQTLDFGDGVRDKVVFGGTVFGADAIRFDAGEGPWQAGPVNVALGISGAAVRADSYRSDAGSYPPELMLNGLANGAMGGNRWVSSGDTPYHWVAIDLGSAFEVSGLEFWGANDAGAAGQVCAYSVHYRPYVMGVTEDFTALVDLFETNLDTYPKFVAHTTEGVFSPDPTDDHSGWELAFGPVDQGSGVFEYLTEDGETYWDTDFPSVAAQMVRIDINMMYCGTSNRAQIFDMRVKGIPIRPLTTLAVTRPSQDRRLTLPDLTGILLADSSTISTLTAVAALDTGSIVSGFGAAEVASLTVTGATVLQDTIVFGDAEPDTITIGGTVVDFAGATPGHFLRLEGTTADGFETTLSLADPTADRVITFPDETGTVLTAVSTVSLLEEVGAVRVGSIAAGFGTAVFSDPSNTGLDVLTADGPSNLNGDVVLGTNSGTCTGGSGDSTGTACAINGGGTGCAVATGSCVYTPGTDTSALIFRGSITTNALVFDEFPDTANGKLTLQFPTDPSVPGYTISFPAGQGGTIVTSETTSLPGLTGVGALDTGSITGSFSIATSTSLSANEITSTTDIIATQALEVGEEVVLSVGTVTAGASIVIPDGTTIVRINQDGAASAANNLVFPDGRRGQVLIVKNNDLQAATSGITPITSIGPGKTCRYVFIGDWESISEDSSC